MTGPYQVERVGDEATLRETTPLIATAFSLPLDETNVIVSAVAYRPTRYWRLPRAPGWGAHLFGDDDGCG